MENFTVYFRVGDVVEVLNFKGDVIRVLDEGDDSGVFRFKVDDTPYAFEGVVVEITRRINAFGYSREQRVY